MSDVPPDFESTVELFETIKQLLPRVEDSLRDLASQIPPNLSLWLFALQGALESMPADVDASNVPASPIPPDDGARQLETTERYLGKRVKNVLCEHFTVLEDRLHATVKESGTTAPPGPTDRPEVENLLRWSEASLTELEKNLNSLAHQVDRYGISQRSAGSS
jgi:hypothetical protein